MRPDAARCSHDRFGARLQIDRGSAKGRARRKPRPRSATLQTLLPATGRRSRISWRPAAFVIFHGCIAARSQSGVDLIADPRRFPADIGPHARAYQSERRRVITIDLRVCVSVRSVQRAEISPLTARCHRNHVGLAPWRRLRRCLIPGSDHDRAQQGTECVVIQVRGSINHPVIIDRDPAYLIRVDKSASYARELAIMPMRQGARDACRAVQDLYKGQSVYAGLRSSDVNSAIWALRASRPCASFTMSRDKVVTLFCVAAIGWW